MPFLMFVFITSLRYCQTFANLKNTFNLLLPKGLSRFAFRRLSERQKKPKKLCDLCDSAVNYLLLKTLLQ